MKRSPFPPRATTSSPMRCGRRPTCRCRPASCATAPNWPALSLRRPPRRIPLPICRCPVVRRRYAGAAAVQSVGFCGSAGGNRRELECNPAVLTVLPGNNLPASAAQTGRTPAGCGLFACCLPRMPARSSGNARSGPFPDFSTAAAANTGNSVSPFPNNGEKHALWRGCVQYKGGEYK